MVTKYSCTCRSCSWTCCSFLMQSWFPFQWNTRKKLEYQHQSKPDKVWNFILLLQSTLQEWNIRQTQNKSHFEEKYWEKSLTKSQYERLRLKDRAKQRRKQAAFSWSFPWAQIQGTDQSEMSVTLHSGVLYFRTALWKIATSCTVMCHRDHKRCPRKCSCYNVSFSSRSCRWRIKNYDT